MTVREAADGVYVIDFFSSEVLAAFSGRRFGRENHSEFLKHLGISGSSFFSLRQKHTDKIFVVGRNGFVPARTEEEAKGSAEIISLSHREVGDGLMTQEKGFALGILTADCVPVFFWDPAGRVIGLAHAGWRGLHQGIVSKMLAVFKGTFKSKPELLKIAFGPCIRQCCYEVGSEFKSYFPETYRPDFSRTDAVSSGHVDLIQEAVLHLTRGGVLAQNIHDAGICTVCGNDRFFSARKEKTEERILSVLQILP